MSRAEFTALGAEKLRELQADIDDSRKEMLGDLILDVVEEWVAADQLALEAARA